jgi:hypothetical protein
MTIENRLMPSWRTHLLNLIADIMAVCNVSIWNINILICWSCISIVKSNMWFWISIVWWHNDGLLSWTMHNRYIGSSINWRSINRIIRRWSWRNCLICSSVVSRLINYILRLIILIFKLSIMINISWDMRRINIVIWRLVSVWLTTNMHDSISIWCKVVITMMILMLNVITIFSIYLLST